MSNRRLGLLAPRQLLPQPESLRLRLPHLLVRSQLVVRELLHATDQRALVPLRLLPLLHASHVKAYAL